MDTRALIAGAAPPPLRRDEKLLLLLASLVIGATRLLAISATLWDWDEALFSLALRAYDVSLHHPQPPGFPLFIALAELLPLDEFHALQAIAVVSSLVVFPLAFALARELGCEFFAATATGLLLAFFPNVWFFGGTAFSDVPSMVLSLAASLLLLQGRRANGRVIAGAVMLGVAAAFRPQNLLIGFVPAVLAMFRRPRAAMAGALCGLAVIVASYGAAAASSGGWAAYRDALAQHAHYIRVTDSFLSPIRPGLLQVADDFFLRPWRAPLLNVVVMLLAAAGLVTRRRSVGLALAIFGPFTIFAWLYLDFHSSSRFSIAYMPLVAIAAAEGLSLLRRARTVVLTAVIALLFFWTLPTLRIVRTTPSPPVAAIETIRDLDPATTIVWVDDRLAAHAAFLLPEYERRSAGNDPPVVGESRATAILLREGASNAPGGRTFSRDDDRLGGIVRQRYFATSLLPVRRLEFTRGWYGEEGPVRRPWRWMSGEGVILLPEERVGGRLTLRGELPMDVSVRVTLDGRPVAQFAGARGPFEQVLRIGPGRELVMTTSAATVDGDDTRRPRLRLDAIELTR